MADRRNLRTIVGVNVAPRCLAVVIMALSTVRSLPYVSCVVDMISRRRTEH